MQQGTVWLKCVSISSCNRITKEMNAIQIALVTIQTLDTKQTDSFFPEFLFFTYKDSFLILYVFWCAVIVCTDDVDYDNV